jgi:drug/metabolite transporter (DMT)-like permease
MVDLRLKDPDSLRPIWALLAVQVLFGSLPSVGKVVLTVVPTFALVGLRVSLAALVLFLFQWVRGRLWLNHRTDYATLAVLSLFGVTLNQLLFIGGLSLTKAANASLLVVTIPIFAVAVGAAFGVGSIRPAIVIGIALAAAGVAILVDPRNASFNSRSTLGDLLIVLNSLSYGIYLATSKHIFIRNGPLRSITWIFIFSSVVCLPLGLFSLGRADLNGLSPSTWMLVAYIAVFATAAPYLLNAWALARVSPTTVAVFVYLQPLIGFIMAAIFLGEQLGLRFIAAVALIFTGVFLTTRRTVGDFESPPPPGGVIAVETKDE